MILVVQIAIQTTFSNLIAFNHTLTVVAVNPYVVCLFTTSQTCVI